MSATIIDGKAFAARLREKIAAKTSALADTLQPGLAVVLVGENPASQVYVRSKTKQAAEVGIKTFDHKLPDTVSQDELLALVHDLNSNPEVHGILVQLPLPDHIDADLVLLAIDPAKDADGFHPVNVGLLATGQPDKALIPCTPYGCALMLKDHLGNMSGKDAVVIGRSNIVGRPMLQLLLQENCTVQVVHSRTKEIEDKCRAADILVAAVGIPHFVKGDWVKPGATVIDVGINRIDGDEPGKTKLVGDVDYAAAVDVAGAITPVPGGVGPMTIACLLANTVKAACAAHGLNAPDWG